MAFHVKPHGSANHANLASAAVYYLTPEALAHVPSDAASDWGRDVFPSIVSAGGALYSYRGSEYLKDVGTPDRLARAKRALRAGLPARRSYRARQRAIFLDRDGVLNEEIDGVYAADQLKLLESAAAGVKAINQKGLLAICVTNQPGLAKGFFDFATLADVHRRLDVMLAQEGAYLDDIYVCPHHPERGFEGEVATLKIDCECRKPQPGLLKQAAEFHNIDLVSSCIIGDRVIDIAAGAAVGAKGYLVNNRDPADAMAVEALQGTVVDGGLQAALQAIFEPHDQTRGSAAC